MDKVRLHTYAHHNVKIIIQDASFLHDKADVEVINAWDEENDDANMPATLKDLSIIMYKLFPCGVQHQLCFELSKYLGVDDPEHIDDVLSSIFREYKDLSDEEAYNRFNAMKPIHE
jgi:hypothetical protein